MTNDANVPEQLAFSDPQKDAAGGDRREDIAQTHLRFFEPGDRHTPIASRPLELVAWFASWSFDENIAASPEWRVFHEVIAVSVRSLKTSFWNNEGALHQGALL